MKLKKYAFFLIIFFSISSAWAQTTSLENDIEKLKAAYAYPNDDQISAVLETVWVFKGGANEDIFHKNTISILHFLFQLHPVEQTIYIRLLKLYQNYANCFVSFEEWTNQIFLYKNYFTSHLSQTRPRPDEDIYQYLLKKTKDLIDYYPLTRVLQNYDTYWKTLFSYKALIPFPSWNTFQKEMEDIEQHQKPFFLWEKRMEESLRDFHKQALLKDPVQWHLEEDHYTFSITSRIILQQDRDVIVADTTNHKEALFKRIFKQWAIKKLYLKNDNTLSVTIADENIQHDLIFDVGEEDQFSSYRLSFALQVPLLLEATLLSQFKIVYQVESHGEFEDLSVINIHSEIRFPFEVSKKLVNLGEVKKQLEIQLPRELEQFRQHLYFLGRDQQRFQKLNPQFNRF